VKGPISNMQLILFIFLMLKMHMVMISPPKYSVSDVIGRIKGRSASNLRKKFKWLKMVYWKENII
jgi:putative transposase